jgi:cytochrome P450
MSDPFLSTGADSSLSLYVNGAFLALVVAFVFHILVRFYTHCRDAAKYPPMAPAGLLETVAAISGDDFPWFMLRMAEALDTRVYQLPLPMPGTPMVAVVGEPDLAKEILLDKNTIKPLAMYGAFNGVTAGFPNIFTSNGTIWHHRRKGVAPAFAANQVQRMNRVALETIDQWIQDKLKSSANQDFLFNAPDEMIDLLLTSISLTAFEYNLSPEEKKLFLTELTLVLKEFFLKSMSNPLRKFVGLFLPERRRAHVAGQRLHELCMKIIQSYRTLENPTPGTIIDLIMKNPNYKDDHERAADVLIMMIGGHDTTAFSLAWTLKELAKNPTLQAELRSELAKEDPSTAHNNATLKKCIREAIRLYPVGAAGSIRELGRDFLTKDNKLVPKGSYVFLSPMLPFRDPGIYGKTANEYDPHRWDDPTPEMNSAFTPFSTGKQNCVGQSLANAELHSMIPRIFSHFELTLEDPGTVGYFLTLKPVNTILKATPLKKNQKE